ncbi:hypothetical protein FOA52_005074 [Chlamydomonas sp. UWO 241]|nr:hypothetical protein FOA52_005074 [Chlamydomonas sp. UWO 241]
MRPPRASRLALLLAAAVVAFAFIRAAAGAVASSDEELSTVTIRHAATRHLMRDAPDHGQEEAGGGTVNAQLDEGGALLLDGGGDDSMTLPRMGLHGNVHGSTDDPQLHGIHGTVEGTYSPVPILSILLYTCIMTACSGLGAVPFFLFGRLKPYWAGLANAVAVGVMLAASFELLHESAPHGIALTVLGMVTGALFIKASQDYLAQFEDASFEELQGADARKAMLIVAVMAAHAFGEGAGVGVSFSGQRGRAQGLLVTIAIGLHNIPEGMAVAGVMMAKGSTPSRALFWTMMCAAPQAVVSVPSFLFVEAFNSLLPVALGFAAGCMVWIAIAELLPDALEAADHGHVATACTLSAAWLQGLSFLIASLEQGDGSLAQPIKAGGWELTRALVVLAPTLAAPAIAAAGAAVMLPGGALAGGACAGALAWIGAARLTSLVVTGQASALGAAGCALCGAALASMALTSTRESGEGELQHHEHAGEDHELALMTANGDSGQQISRTGSGSAQPPHADVPSKVLINDGSHGHTQPYSRPGAYALHAGGGGGGGGTTNGWAAAPAPLSSYDGGGDLLPVSKPSIGGSSNSKTSGRQTLPFAACVLVLQGLPAGLTVAATAARALLPPAASTPTRDVASPLSLLALALPAVIEAVPFGVAACGLARLMPGWRGGGGGASRVGDADGSGAAGRGARRGAAVLGAAAACVAGATAALLLACQPLGMGGSLGSIGGGVGDGWGPATSAACAGAALLAASRHVWPIATAGLRTAKARHRTHAGLLLAALLGCASAAAHALVCASTPHCMHL